jgi:O-antigen ligase
MIAPARPQYPVLGTWVVPIVIIAGATAVAWFGVVAAVVTAIVIAGLVVTAIWTNTPERMVIVVFLGALFSKLFAVLSGVLYLPIIFDAALAVTLAVTVMTRVPGSVPEISRVVAGAWFVFMFTAIAELFNPNVPSALAAAQGFRVTAFNAFAFWLGVLTFVSVRELRQLFRWIIVAGVFVAANGVRQLFWRIPLDARFIEVARSGAWVFELTGQGLAKRAFSIFPGPFHLGYFGVQVSLLAWYIARTERRRWYWIAMAVLIAGALASLTRSTLFALVGAFATAIMLSGEGYLRRGARVIASVVLMVAFVLLLGALIPQVGILLSVAQSPISEPHFVSRVETWQMVWPIIWNQPILAYGISSAGDALGDLYTNSTAFHIVPHNVILKLLLEIGIVGTTAFVILVAGPILRVLRRLSHSSRDERILGAALIGSLASILAQGLTGSGVEAYPTNTYFWFLLGVCARFKPERLSGPPARVVPTFLDRDHGLDSALP